MMAVLRILLRPARAAIALPLAGGLVAAVPGPATTAEPPAPVMRPVPRPATATPGAAAIRLQPVPGCAVGAECVVAVATEMQPAAGDRRRLAFAFDWPAGLPAPRGEGGWRCRPLSEGETVCLGRIEDVAANPAARLVLRPEIGPGKPEMRLCPKPFEAYAAAPSPLVPDAGQVRLLQAVLADERGLAGAALAAGVPDGVVAGETRQGLVARARASGVPTEPEGVMVAALLGSEINRLVAPAPSCVALVVAAPVASVPPAATAARPRQSARPEAVAPSPSQPAAPAGAQPGPPQGLAPPQTVPPAPPRAPDALPTSPDEILTWRPWRAVRPPLQGLRRLFGG